VVVADNGAGISAEVRAHIFEPFFTTKTDTGTGLGLSLVKRYLDLYGASLSVESEPGDHTRFSVRFPSRPDIVEPRRQSEGEALMDRSGFNEILRRRGGTPKDASGRPRVLVIDDDRGIREALRVELGTLYDVSLADSAIQGIAALDTKPAVILLDIKMRGEDGFYAFREIRKIDALVPIIFHSAYQDVKNPYEIMNVYKPFAYLTKGGDLRALHRQLELAIDYHQKHIATKTELSDKLKKMSEEVERLRALMKK
jgi:CheY-like chemotaxis protein